MVNKKALGAAVIAFLLIGLLPTTVARAAEEAPSPADVALAMRLCDLGQRLAADRTNDLSLRQAAALLEGAHRADPKEPRYARLLAVTMGLTHNRAGQLAAITDLRKLVPYDQMAMLEFIGLNVDRMETVDQKLAYLNDLLGKEVIAKEVRSVVAFQAAQLYSERKQPDKSDQMLDEALKLDPINLKALRVKYAGLPPEASSADRVKLLLDMLRSNPAQPVLSSKVAQELATAGMVNESVKWYTYAATAISKGAGVQPEDMRPLMLNTASEMFIASQFGPAQNILDQLLANDPGNYPALVLRLLIEKRGGQKEATDKLRMTARNSLLNALATVRSRMGVKDAVTKPIDEAAIPAPDLSEDIERVKKLTDANLKGGYLQALSDLAWFELYFNGQTTEAEKLLGLFTAMSDPTDQASSTFAARTAGWIFLTQPTKIAEAKVKLSAAADRDPMAKLGLILTYGPDEDDKAKAEAEKLISSQPSGVLGAMLWDNLQSKGVKVALGPNAAALQAVLATFPADWMRIIDVPQAFYSLHGEPVKIVQPFGEPLMVTMTIRNVNKYDITIGDEGVIQPTLWFDVRLSGLMQQNLPGVCLDRLTDQIVLRPNQSITRTVRLDQLMFAQFLSQNPSTPITLTPTARTNVASVTGNIASGPCGYSTEFGRPMERSGFELTQAGLNQLKQAAANGDGREKIRNLQLMAVIASALRTQKDKPELQAQGDGLLETIRRTDGDDSVRAWALFLSVLYGTPAQQEATATKMLADTAWQSRLLGLAALSGLPLEKQKALAEETLRKEKVDFIKDFAMVNLKVMKTAAATQPTTQPATKPSAK
jgi:tetratricopeptide (TPR) repeat protein